MVRSFALVWIVGAFAWTAEAQALLPVGEYDGACFHTASPIGNNWKMAVGFYSKKDGSVSILESIESPDKSVQVHLSTEFIVSATGLISSKSSELIQGTCVGNSCVVSTPSTKTVSVYGFSANNVSVVKIISDGSAIAGSLICSLPISTTQH